MFLLLLFDHQDLIIQIVAASPPLITLPRQIWRFSEIDHIINFASQVLFFLQIAPQFPRQDNQSPKKNIVQEMNDADDQGPQVGFYQYWVVLRQVLKKMSGTGRVPGTQWALVMMELENKKTTITMDWR